MCSCVMIMRQLGVLHPVTPLKLNFPCRNWNPINNNTREKWIPGCCSHIVEMHFHSFIHLPIYLSTFTHLSINLFTYLPDHLLTHLPAYSPTHLLSIHSSAYLHFKSQFFCYSLFILAWVETDSISTNTAAANWPTVSAQDNTWSKVIIGGRKSK
jgi:hypothetical protein